MIRKTLLTLKMVEFSNKIRIYDYVLTCSIVTLNSSDLQDKYAAVTLKYVGLFKKLEKQVNFESNSKTFTYNISFG